MPYRRSVIKTIGAVGIGSVATSGLVTAQEEPKTDTFKTVERGPTLNAGGVVLVNPVNTEPFTFQAYPESAEEPKFDSAEVYRIDATLTWNSFNPQGEGPTDANLFLEQQDSGGWKEIARAGNGSGLVSVTQNEVQMTITGSGLYTTKNYANSEPSTNNYEIRPGNQYRFVVEGEVGPVLCSITGEIQALNSKPTS